LRQIGIEKLKNHLTKKIGKKDLILIEKVQNENSIGKDQNFFNVIVNEKIKEGDIIACVYTGVNNNMLMAKRI
jgi:tRNA A37 methylthiotransferase MiaB